MIFFLSFFSCTEKNRYDGFGGGGGDGTGVRICGPTENSEANASTSTLQVGIVAFGYAYIRIPNARTQYNNINFLVVLPRYKRVRACGGGRKCMYY
jgi:hypothetical protein